MFQPNFRVTGLIANALIAIEADRQIVSLLPLSALMLDSLRRTARLLTNLVLHRSGYGLNGIYSLEEYYAANLDGYYRGLAVGPSHNYYLGRAEADVTAFVEYFCVGMASAFGKVRRRAEEGRLRALTDPSPALRTLTPQQRRSFGLFLRTRQVTSADVATYFDLSTRRGAALCVRWVEQGFLVVHDPSTKGRSYRLSDVWEATVAAQALEQRDGREG